MSKKILGLDLGSSSIGWTIRNEDNTFKSGVITFESGMTKGQGGYSSPTKDRREARSRRRLLQARRYRKWELLKVLIKNNMVPLSKKELEAWCKYKKGEPQKFPETPEFLKWLACDFTYINGTKYKNPYELRVHALDKKVHPHEFGRALYHLVQRRGYKNIGELDFEDIDIKAASKDSETKKQLERREKDGFSLALQKHNGIISKALKYEFLDKEKRARNQYPLRKEYRLELEELCKSQEVNINKDHSGNYIDNLIKSLWKAIIWQRPLRSQKGNIGRCTLEPSRLRCPSSHPLFEIFRAWQFINNIKYKENGNFVFLPQNIRNNLFEEFFLRNNKNVKFKEIRKFLNIKLGNKKTYNYNDNYSVSTMPICKGLIDIFGDSVKSQILNLEDYIIGGNHDRTSNKKAPKIIANKYSVFDLWHALFSFDKVYLKTFAREKLGVKDIEKEGKKVNPFTELHDTINSSYAKLSVKAISKIIPFLKNGHIYDEAVLLSKMPVIFGVEWENKKNIVLKCFRTAKKEYKWQKIIIIITNKLIDNWKGLENHEKFAYKDTSYKLQDSDFNDVLIACQNHYGNQTWKQFTELEKENILKEVKKQYEEFFKDPKRRYRIFPTLDELLKSELKKEGIELSEKLYHHSIKDNPYLQKLRIKEDGTPQLPVDKNTNIEILPLPITSNIKNPMFTKALSVLRKLINYLIITGQVDRDTEVVIEVARELNDNNMRIAIERFQRERENLREQYRKLLEEFKEKENLQLNIEENLSKIELWSEQIFDKEKKGKDRLVRHSLLKKNENINKYELWMEQKGICMYTGKTISLSQLFSNEVDIEHTIPRSILPDNSLANQTICFKWYNTDRKRKQIPTQCENYDKDVDDWGTSIKPRLDNWEEIRKHYEELYEKNKKPNPSEDESKKNKRIQNKHYYKMHLNYWTEKISRFTCTEIKDSWVRRQLTDTQIISKYAIQFLSTYFKPVKVQKGSVTSEFRKILGFQEQDEIKNRNKHTHHAIDAAVLTLIPTNSSYTKRLLKEMYESEENNKGKFKYLPFENFNSQTLINQIENNTLVVNYTKDNMLKKTFKKIRNRGRIVHLKDKNGNYIFDGNNKKIKRRKGDSFREGLYQQTFVAKLRDVEKDKNGKPLRNHDGSFKFKEGKDAFFYAVRVSVDEAKKYIDDIIDPVIKDLIIKQKNNSQPLDYNNKPIRHIRIKANAGKVVKHRLNYLSKQEYKNYYYAASKSLPYAVLIERTDNNSTNRILIPISTSEIAKTFKQAGKFNVQEYISIFHPEYVDYNSKKLLKLGQKIIVLKNDSEFEIIKEERQILIKRFYIINQFEYKGDKIILKYHLEARSEKEIDTSIKEKKHNILNAYEKKLEIPEIQPDINIQNISEREKEYAKRLYDFKARLKVIKERDTQMGLTIEQELNKHVTQASKLNDDNPAPILGLSSRFWNFLIESIDFEINPDGEIIWKF